MEKGGDKTQDGQGQTTPPADAFDHIRLGATDAREQVVRKIYSKVSGTFVVYLAEDQKTDEEKAEARKPKSFWRIDRGTSSDSQVRIEYSPIAAERVEQLKLLATLRALRGEIDGLQDKLLTALAPEDPWDRLEVESFNRQVADALVIALQGQPDYAFELLQAIRADIIERLASLARFQYCRCTLTATITGIVCFALLIFGSSLIHSVIIWSGLESGASFWSTFRNDPVQTFAADNYLWVSMIFGCLGAWFSIALGIRAQTYALSNRRLDNFVDASLRVLIAIISAILLFSIVRLNLFSVSFGGKALDFSCMLTDVSCHLGKSWNGVHVAIILSFVAGFSERLVGSILGPAIPEGQQPEPEPPPTNATTTTGTTGQTE